jgi:hypothetical protein
MIAKLGPGDIAPNRQASVTEAQKAPVILLSKSKFMDVLYSPDRIKQVKF